MGQVLGCLGRKEERVSARNERRLENSSNTARNERRVNNSSDFDASFSELDLTNLSVLDFDECKYSKEIDSILHFLCNPSEVLIEEGLQRGHSLPEGIPERRNRRESGKSNGGLGREENHVSSGNEGSLKLKVSIGQNPVSSTEMAKESNGTNVPDQQRRSDGTKFADGHIAAVKRPVRPDMSTEIAKGSNGTKAFEGSCEDPPVPDQQRRSDGTSGLEVSCEVPTVEAKRPAQVHKPRNASRKAAQVHKRSKALRKGEIESEGKAGWGIVRLLRNPYEQSTEKGVRFSEALWRKIAECKNRRQSGKSNGGLEGKENHVSSGNVGRLELNDLPDGGNEELWSVEPTGSSTKIAKDSFEGRPVPVRVHLVESGQDPVWLAPGIRICSLEDLIQALSDDSALLCVDSVNELMRDLILDLGRWHDKGRIHSDLKPKNILITEISAKLPDLGTIHGDASCHPTDCENSGWRACEQLLGESSSCATNMFSVGCAWFMLLSRGKHPFGDHPQERDNNIWEDNMNLSSLKFTQQAKYFFWRMLNADPKLRPETWEMLSCFWSPAEKLRLYAWFIDVLQSNSALGRDLLNELESGDPVFNGEWINLIDPIFKDGIERRNNDYDYTSVKDFMRYMRNLFSHPTGIKEIKGIRRWDDRLIYSYFADKVPSLWLKTYRAASRFCGEEDWFKGFHREEPFFGGGCENSGWEAREQLLGEKPSCATDVFCLGIIWFMLLSGGEHPFGDPQERDNNIRKGNMNLSSVKLEPELEYLISRMLNSDPKFRPETREVLSWFWFPEKKGRFYVRFSDILHSNDPAPSQDLLNELEGEEDEVSYEHWIDKINPICREGIEKKGPQVQL